MLRMSFVIILFGGFSTLIAANDFIDAQKPRECFSCEGVNCQRTSKLDFTVQCRDVLDICVTIFEQSAVVAKGCYMDMPVKLRSKCDEHNNPECFKCFGQKCNNKARADLKCIECNSRDNSKCALDTSGITPTQCLAPTAGNTYCYVRGNNDGVTSRGCAVHVEEQLDCMTDETCRLCLPNDGEACNAFNLDNPRSAATKTVASISILAIVLLVVRS